MDTLLDNIKILLKNKKINSNQAIYLIYLFNEIPMHISSNGLRGLVSNGYVVSNRVATTLLISSKAYSNDLLEGTLDPKYDHEYSQTVVKTLCKLFCIVDEKTKDVVFPGRGYTTPKEIADNFLQKEEILVYYFLIFLFMFPVQGETNKRWDKHFIQNRYKGPKLR